MNVLLPIEFVSFRRSVLPIHLALAVAFLGLSEPSWSQASLDLSSSKSPAVENSMDVFMQDLGSSIDKTEQSESEGTPEGQMDSGASAAQSQSGGSDSTGSSAGASMDSGSSHSLSMDSGVPETNLDSDAASSKPADSSPNRSISLDSGSGTKSPSQELSISTDRNRYKQFVSFDLPDGDLFNTKDVDPSQCMELCNKDKTCTAVTYDRWNRFCFAKNVSRSTGQLFVQAKSDTYILEKEANGITAARTTIELKRRPGKGFNGTPDYSASNTSYDDCKRRCEQDGHCVAFNHIIARRACEFFSQPPEYFSRNGFEIGVKQQVQ